MSPLIRPYRILIVEDNPDHAILIEIVFAHDLNAHVDVTRSAEEAVTYLEGRWLDDDERRRQLPDVIVLDINMPGIGGLGFLEWYSRQQDVADIPVVVFTSAGDPELAQQCFALGAKEFQEKPSDFSELAPVVHRALARWRPAMGAASS